jgi:hypothetical protein
MKNCFVISPIGDSGSNIRQQADDVLEYIIEPALKAMGVEAVRGDQFSEPGLITSQIVEAILTSDLCIADLSGHNPNVFYELAIAQAARRPVVLLKLIGERIPFDVKDYRIIEYDLTPRSLKTDKWIPLLKAQVAAVLAPSFSTPSILGSNLLDRNENIRSYIANGHSTYFGDMPKYYEIASSAEKFCYIMGVSLKVWASQDGKRVLTNLVQRGIPVRVLIMNPTNPGLDAIINAKLPTERSDTTKSDIQGMEEYFRNITKLDTTGAFQVRTLEKGMLHFQLILTEKTVLVLQYMFCCGAQDSPLQLIPARSELYRVFYQEFEELWIMNEANKASGLKSDSAALTREKPY